MLFMCQQMGLEIHAHVDDPYWTSKLTEGEPLSEEEFDKVFELESAMLDYARKTFPADDPCIVNILVDLAWIKASQGYADATPYVLEALAELERQRGTDGPVYMYLASFAALGYRANKDPLGKEHLRRIINIARSNGNDEQNVLSLEHMLEHYDDYRFDVEQWQQRATRYSNCKADEQRQTIARLSILLEFDNNDWQSFYFRGRGYYLLGDDQQALKDFDQVVKLVPGEPYGYAAKARQFRELQQYENALEQYDVAIQLSSAPSGEGGSNRKYDRTLDYRLSNENQWCYMLSERSQIFEKIDRIDDAIQDLNTLLDAKEGRELLWFFRHRAVLHEKAGNAALAAADLDSYEAHRKDLEQRVERYRLEPKDDSYQENLARKNKCDFDPRRKHYSHEDEARKHIDTYTRVASRLTDDAESFFHRAQAYQHLGDHVHALPDFLKIVELQPLYPEAYSAAAKIMLNAADYSQVIEVIDRKFQMCGQDSESLLLRATAYEQLGRAEEATEDLEKALPLVEKYREQQFREARGFLFEKMGKLELAAIDKRFCSKDENASVMLKEKAPHMLIRHWGYININGELELKPDVDRCGDFSDGLTYARRTDGFLVGYLDRTGDWAITPRYGSAGSFANGLATITFGQRSLDTLTGFIDRTGHVAITPKYSTSFGFRDGYAIVYGPRSANRRAGLIDTQGIEVIPIEYDDIDRFCGHLARVKLADKYGYYDKQGQCVVRPQFEEAGEFCNDRAPVRVNGKWGFIDGEGKMVIEPRFVEASVYSAGLSVVINSDGLSGTIDADGNYTIEPKFEGMARFCDGLAFVWIGEKLAVIDQTGSVVVPARFDDANWFEGAMAAVRIGDKWGFIDSLGQDIIEARFDEVREPSWRSDCSSICVRIGEKWGFVHRASRKIVEPQFDEIRDFYQGMAAVRHGEPPGGKWGFIDIQGHCVCRATFDYVSNSEGLAKVGSFDGL